VIDAVDLFLVETLRTILFSSLAWPDLSQRFFNDDAHPGIRRRRASETGTSELLNNGRINFRRRGKVNQAVAADVLCRFDLRESFAELRVGLGSA